METYETVSRYALSTSGTKKDSLPIDSKNKEKSSKELGELTSSSFVSYEKHIDLAKQKFNDAIRDGQFTLEEQRDVYNSLESAKESLDTYVASYDAQGTPVSIEMPHQMTNLHGLLNKNLNGVDFFKPTSLEETLRKEGYSVSVEGTYSTMEMGLTAAAIASSILAIYFRKKLLSLSLWALRKARII